MAALKPAGHDWHTEAISPRDPGDKTTYHIFRKSMLQKLWQTEIQESIYKKMDITFYSIEGDVTWYYLAQK